MYAKLNIIFTKTLERFLRLITNNVAYSLGNSKLTLVLLLLLFLILLLYYFYHLAFHSECAILV